MNFRKDNSKRLIASRENCGYTLANSMFQELRSCHTFDASSRPHMKMGLHVSATKGTLATSISFSTYMRQTIEHSDESCTFLNSWCANSYISSVVGVSCTTRIFLMLYTTPGLAMGTLTIEHLYRGVAKLSSSNASLIDALNSPVSSTPRIPVLNRLSIFTMCWWSMIATRRSASRKFGRWIVPMVDEIFSTDARSSAGLYLMGPRFVIRGVYASEEGRKTPTAFCFSP
mmetsp:Transcript_16539/g.35944  ORF Transcript_16539/g.35944 Transcript_16539/m.35944 type:complete len:229 (-) Transcript_16539:258-944(-)